MILNKLSGESLTSYIREIMTEDMLKDYFSRMIVESNFEAYEKFFLSLKFDASNNEESLKSLVRLFLLFNESINVSDNGEDDLDKYLSLLFAELEFFDSGETGEYPNKEFIRDYLVSLYYKNPGKAGYHDETNIENELSKLDENALSLIRYLDQDTKSELASYESDIAASNILLNGDLKHGKYLKSIKQAKPIPISITDRDTLSVSPPSITVNSGNTDSIKNLSKKISAKTIHYKV